MAKFKQGDHVEFLDEYGRYVPGIVVAQVEFDEWAISDGTIEHTVSVGDFRARRAKFKPKLKQEESFSKVEQVLAVREAKKALHKVLKRSGPERPSPIREVSPTRFEIVGTSKWFSTFERADAYLKKTS